MCDYTVQNVRYTRIAPLWIVVDSKFGCRYLGSECCVRGSFRDCLLYPFLVVCQVLEPVCRISSFGEVFDDMVWCWRCFDGSGKVASWQGELFGKMISFARLSRPRGFIPTEVGIFHHKDIQLHGCAVTACLVVSNRPRLDCEWDSAHSILNLGLHFDVGHL